MFLVFTLVLLVVAIGIMVSVYSIFFPFMQNIGSVNQYYMAYYGAVSAVERAELGLRYRSPGFVGSGGFLGTIGYGPMSDYSPELFSGTQQGFWWTINSRTTSIPAVGMGNTDTMLSASDSKDYNQLGYINLETFLLGYDSTLDSECYYTGCINTVYFSGGTLTGVFRLPPKLFNDISSGSSHDGLLCDSSLGECDSDGDGVYDDVALYWFMQGRYKGNEFKISPSLAVFSYSGEQIVDTLKDNALRESIINATGTTVTFDTYPVHTYTFITHGANLNNHTVVSSDADILSGIGFSEILTSSDFSGLSLSFGAANFFRTFIGTLYPYLEYQFTFPEPVVDRFYTIEGHGRVGDYDVKIVIKKPTVQGTVGGDFTVIF